MPKLKTHSGTKDRVRITKNGKVLRRHAMGGHFLQKKSASRKRKFAGVEAISTKAIKNSIKKRLGV
jgi:large subunit ribosomal protein L35